MEVGGQQDFERIDGVIHQVQIGTDVNGRTTYKIGQEVMDKRLKISSICVDREFLSKFGKLHVLIMVFSTEGNERTFIELIDQVQLTHDMSDLLKGGTP